MPLVKPQSKSSWEDLFWKETRRSDFLTLERSSTTKSHYRILLVHNGYVVASANSLKEAEELWIRCLRITELAKSGTRLVSTFESLWKEYEDGTETGKSNLTTSQSDLVRSHQNLLHQKKHVLLQLTDLLEETKKELQQTHVQEIPDFNIAFLAVAIKQNDSEEKMDDEYIKFDIGDTLLVLNHPREDLFYAQSLSEFGIIEKNSVQILNNTFPSRQESTEHEICKEKEEFKKHQEIGSMQGYLEKRGFWISKDWKRRWFVLDLTQGRLYYFVNQSDVERKNHRGFIDLSEITTVHETYAPDSRQTQLRWPFEIHTPKRVWFLAASRNQEMEMWIRHINQYALMSDRVKSYDPNFYKKHRVKVLQNDISLNLKTTTPGADNSLKPSITLECPAEVSEIDSIRRFCAHISQKEEIQKIQYDANDFSQFGAPDGEEILNKSTILGDIDKFLGHHHPPDVEYIYVEPYLNYASKGVYLTANPYGHAVVRYTLPDTKEQLLMNIVGLADHELVNFLHPEDFFFSTNFDTKIGNEQGGIYNRNFASIRIQRVPPEKILAMHQYFLDLHSRSHTNWADYNILLGPILNRASSVSYGNCAHWSSQGLRQAGLMKHTSMFPKAIWVDLFETLKLNCQQDIFSNNISVVYYKRVLHAKRFYGEDADWTGWGRPTTFFGKKAYDNLEQCADAIVYVPAGTKTAKIQAGAKNKQAERSFQLRQFKEQGRIFTEMRFDVHVEPRILFNEIFYKRFNIETLERTPVNNQLRTMDDHPFKMLRCGYPLFSNCWLVDHSEQLFKTSSNTGSIEDLRWLQINPPVLSVEVSNPTYTLLAPGEDGSCWTVYGGALFYRLVTSESWEEVEKPSHYEVMCLCTVNIVEGVWILDSKQRLFRWNIQSKVWFSYTNAPNLKSISTGENEELWGVTEDCKVFRRIRSSCEDKGKWIQLHGALLSTIAVASPQEVWGVDAAGKVYVWSEEQKDDNSEDIDENIDSTPSMSWQSLGNILPISTINVNSQKIPWGISDVDPGFIYKLSRHRLLVLSTKSSRKIWDDRNTPSKPYEVGFWRPLPPKNFYSLGDIAERSHLENSSVESIVVCEVGRQEGEIEILVPPKAYEMVWGFKGNSVHYSDCAIWRAIPPSRDYIAMGHVVTSSMNPPSVDLIRCVHRKFLNASKPCNLSQGDNKFLWLSPSRSSSVPISLWLIKPRLDSLWCNVFISAKGASPPQNCDAACLKLSAA